MLKALLELPSTSAGLVVLTPPLQNTHVRSHTHTHAHMHTHTRAHTHTHTQHTRRNSKAATSADLALPPRSLAHALLALSPAEAAFYDVRKGTTKWCVVYGVNMVYGVE